MKFKFLGIVWNLWPIVGLVWGFWGMMMMGLSFWLDKMTWWMMLGYAVSFIVFLVTAPEIAKKLEANME